MPPSLFQKLPSELLITIFEQANSYARSHLDPDVPQVPFPIVLTHVCRFWRHVAIDVATLWAQDVRIHIPGNQHTARLYLERSKSCLLDFTLISEDEEEEDRFIAEFTELVLPYVERWRRLTLIYNGESVTCCLPSLLQEVSPPHLEVLEIASYRASSAFRTDWTPVSLRPMLMGGAPNLRTCRLWGMPTLAQTFDKLTALTIVMKNRYRCTLSELKQFLGHVSRSLVYLRLEFYVNVPFGTQEARSIELSALRFLDITNCPILPFISTPKLEHLALQGLNGNMSSTFMSHTVFPSLRSVVLEDIPLTNFACEPHFVTAHPNLTSLAFLRCPHEDRLLHLLQLPKPGSGDSPSGSFSANDKPPFPKLRALAICDISNWTLLQSILADRIARGYTSISRVCVPSGKATECILPHLQTWLGTQNIKLQVICDEVLPPKFKYGEGEQGWLEEISQFEFGVAADDDVENEGIEWVPEEEEYTGHWSADEWDYSNNYY